VRLVIADTGPLNYLILIGHIDLLPVLFEKVVLPTTVQSELASSKAPPLVRHWIANRPAWVEVREAPLSQVEDASLKGIDAGEKAAIQLAVSLIADLLPMVDRKGVNAAQRKGLRVTGALGILDLAAERGLSDFAEAVEQLRQTTSEFPRFYWIRCWKNTRRKKGLSETAM
jgi:predicted nucleic acid-binding protein